MQSQGEAGPASGQGGQAGLQPQGVQWQLQLQDGLAVAQGTVPGQQQQLPVPQPGQYHMQQQIYFDSLTPAQKQLYMAAHPLPQQQPQNPTGNLFIIPPNAQQGQGTSSIPAEFAASMVALSKADVGDGKGFLIGCVYKV